MTRGEAICLLECVVALTLGASSAVADSQKVSLASNGSAFLDDGTSLSLQMPFDLAYLREHFDKSGYSVVLTNAEEDGEVIPEITVYRDQRALIRIEGYLNEKRVSRISFEGIVVHDEFGNGKGVPLEKVLGPVAYCREDGPTGYMCEGPASMTTYAVVEKSGCSEEPKDWLGTSIENAGYVFPTTCYEVDQILLMDSITDESVFSQLRNYR